MKIKYQNPGIILPRWNDVPVGSTVLRHYKGNPPVRDDPVLFFKIQDGTAVALPNGNIKHASYMQAHEYTYQILDVELVVK